MNDMIIDKKLCEAIKRITDDEDLLFCIPRLLKNDENKKAMISFIENGEDVTHATIQLYAIDLCNASDIK